MAIKNPQIIHWRIKGRYICNGACFITESKCAKEIEEVTCENCLRKLEKRGLIK